MKLLFIYVGVILDFKVPSNDLRIAVIPEQMLLLSYTYWNDYDNKYNIQG